MKEELGKESQNRIARTWQPEWDRWKRTDRTMKPDQNNQDKIVRIARAG
jgi:hypothetical protein